MPDDGDGRDGRPPGMPTTRRVALAVGAGLVATGLGTSLAVRGAARTPSPRPLPTHESQHDYSQPTLIGWSGVDIPGLQSEIIGTWMARDSWAGMAAGNWLRFNTNYTKFVAQHPTAAADIGVPIIPHDSGQDLNDLLNEVVRGARDDELRRMGAALAGVAPRVLYARLFWEMNGLPRPATGMSQFFFKEAWNHAVPLIRKSFAAASDGRKSIKIVVCPLTDGARYEDFFPDVDMVDVVALDVYGSIWAGTDPTPDEVLASVSASLSRIKTLAAERGRPVAIGEWGNVAPGRAQGDRSRGLGDSPQYVDLIFDWLEENRAEYAVYFNLASNGIGQTLTDTPESLRRFKQRASELRRTAGTR